MLDTTQYEKIETVMRQRKSMTTDFCRYRRLPGTPTFYLNGRQLTVYDTAELIKRRKGSKINTILPWEQIKFCLASLSL